MQAIAPVVAVLRKSADLQLVTYATRESWSVIYEMGLPVERLDEPRFAANPNAAISTLFDVHQPDLLLSGLSPVRGTAPETPEQFAILEARERGVPSLAVQDYWGMYAERFSRDGDALDRGLLPDRLCVLDRRARNDLVAFGVPVQSMTITHNPWMDRLVAEAATHTRRGTSSVLKVLLVSQPLAEMQHVRSRPYDQYIVFETLLAAMPQSTPNRLGVIIQVLPHPSEDRMRWQKLLGRTAGDVRVELCQSVAPELLRDADYVVTSHSTLAYEASYFGTPCISLRPGAESLPRTWSDDIGLSQVFHDVDSLRQYLRLHDPGAERQRVLRLKKELAADGLFFSDGQATVRVVSEIVGLLDHRATTR